MTFQKLFQSIDFGVNKETAVPLPGREQYRTLSD